jgi:hypothetical protein
MPMCHFDERISPGILGGESTALKDPADVAGLIGSESLVLSKQVL